MSASIPKVEWSKGVSVGEQTTFRQLLQRIPLDYEGTILNFTLNSNTGVIEISYKLGFKGSKEIATIIKRQIKDLPLDIRNRDALIRTMKAEWKGYKEVSNRYTKEKNRDEKTNHQNLMVKEG